MKIELWPIDKPKPYTRNARKISDLAVEKVARSIKDFGWRQPIVVDGSGVIIAGHTRLLAAKKLDEKKVPVCVAADLTPEQVKAYRLADNRSHEEAEWDLEMLGSELFDLKELGFDLESTAFDDDELSKLLAPKELLTDEDAVPEPPKVPVSKRGQVWLLGRHRVMCGDSTSASDVEKLLDGVKPLLMVADPPYGVNYDAEWRERTGLNGPGSAKGKVSNDDRADWREAWVLFPGDVAYVWQGDQQLVSMAEQLTASGFVTRNLIVWAKSSLVISRGNYHPQHETCWYAVRKGGTGNWNGDRKQTTLWQIDKPQKSETGHSTQKPVECMRRPIVNNSSPGQAVYDPFCGSGSTLIACETEGRSCFAMELDPIYVDVIVTRWEQATGKKAVLAEQMVAVA